MTFFRGGLFLFLLLTSPLYGQNFEALLNELSGSSEADQGESAPLPVSQEPLSPSSTGLDLPTVEKDIFAKEDSIKTNGVILQGLDKPTARVFINHAAVGQTIAFGSLNIIVHRCEKAPLDDRQESIAFVTITEKKPNATPVKLFSGWMIASSPALSSFDHPTYDVWIKECKNKEERK